MPTSFQHQTALGEMLAPVAERLRGTRPTVQPISQVNFELHATNGSLPFDLARGVMLDFIQRRSGGQLPSEARRGTSFTLDDVGAQPVEVVAIEEPRYWALRFDDQDRGVPGRSWVIEAAVADQDHGRAPFGLRLHCVSRGANPPVERTVPAFVRDIVARSDARLDGRRIALDPWVIEDEDAVEELVALLRAPSRRSDVVVISAPEGETAPSEAAIAPHDIARRLVGVAHVAFITGPATFHLTDRVGKEFSVFRQAVRTYRPRFDPDTEEPFTHPLGLPKRISEWAGGSGGYADFLVSRTLQTTVEDRDATRRLPPFAEIKRTATALRRKAARQEGSSDAELLRLAEEEIARLNETAVESKAEYDALLEQADRDRDTAETEVRRLQALADNLKERLRSEQIVPLQDAAPPIPEDLVELDAWARTQLSGDVELHSRALRAARNARYEDPSLVYKTLLLLRDAYVPMKREGGIEYKDAFEAGCRELGIEESSSFAGTRAGEQGDTYVIKHGGRKLDLDRHLKKGTTKDDRYCFRLYFTWDEPSSSVVVGSLPAHLRTRAT